MNAAAVPFDALQAAGLMTDYARHFMRERADDPACIEALAMAEDLRRNRFAPADLVVMLRAAATRYRTAAPVMAAFMDMTADRLDPENATFKPEPEKEKLPCKTKHQTQRPAMPQRPAKSYRFPKRPRTTPPPCPDLFTNYTGP